MPLMPAICTQCKGALTVDPKEKSGVCPYCGTAFLSEDVINNYNITNVQNNVTNIGNLHADVVNVQDSKSADNLYKKAVTYLNFKDFTSAFTAFDEMTKTYPYDHRGWKGIILAYTRNLDKTFFVEANNVNWVKYYYDLYVKAKNFSGIVIENDPTDKYYAFAKQCAINNINAMCENNINELISKHDNQYGAEAKEKAKSNLKEWQERKKELEKAKKRSLGKFILICLIVSLVIGIAISVLTYIFKINYYSDPYVQMLRYYDVEGVLGSYRFYYWEDALNCMAQSAGFGFFLIASGISIVLIIIKALTNRGKEKFNKVEYENVLKNIKGKELFINGAYDNINKFALEDTIKNIKSKRDRELSLIK